MSRTVIRSPQHDRFRGLGSLAVAWIEHFVVHGPGDVRERPLDPALPDALPLGDEFIEFIADAYACDANGKRLYNDAFVSRAKGWAKSELAGFIVLFEAFGPCRVERTAFGTPRIAAGGEVFTAGSFRYEYEAGEFIGAPITDPIIRCLATEEQQAGNTYDVVLVNLGFRCDGSRRLIEAYGVKAADVGILKVKLPGMGEIIPSTASSSSKDGGKETMVVFDESHLYITAELRRMYDTISRNLGKRVAAEPWSLETSTMYGPGENSVAEATHKHALAILEAKTDAVATLFDHRQAPADVDITDVVALRAAIIEAYGDAAAYTDIDRKVADFRDPRKSVESLRRYTLNQPTAASDAWLTAVLWGAVAPREGEVLALQPGDKIALGFDGSQKRAKGIADATALVACRISDGLLVPLLVAEQPEGPVGADWEVDTGAFDDAVRDAFTTYEVVAFFADPPLWQEYVATWEHEFGNDLPTKASRTAIAWWTTRDYLMGQALDAFEGAVRDGDLRHNGDLTLTRHVLNARRRPRGQHMRIMKEHAQSANKIDAAIAATLAYAARLKHIGGAAAAPAPKRRRTSRFAAA